MSGVPPTAPTRPYEGAKAITTAPENVENQVATNEPTEVGNRQYVYYYPGMPEWQLDQVDIGLEWDRCFERIKHDPVKRKKAIKAMRDLVKEFRHPRSVLAPKNT